ncbi:MAG: excinuclease ABC subunit UvrC, partial [Candidatus Eremiobacteraeota bacterium]|nr:excinuclease ABC subunit UvrC [Candidatus Eremiobacteraeota bacterium]
SAARLRDRIVQVRRVTENQKVVWRSRVDMDLIGMARAQGQACLQVFLVRSGKLIAQEHFILDGVRDQSDAELYSEFLKQFYTARTAAGFDGALETASPARQALENEAPVALRPRSRRQAASALPKEVLVTSVPVDQTVIESWLTELKGQRVRILRAARGPRADYLRLVQTNAESNLKAFLAHQEVEESAQMRSLTELANALELPEPPQRIECYDISNISGSNPTSSMVVFIGGRARKSEYRRFKIQYDRGPNDFAMMQETLRRRLRYLRARTDQDLTGERAALLHKEKFSAKPDLLLIDGGKGQLSAVQDVLEEMDMTGIPVAGLAKEHEWLYLPGQPDPIVLPPNSAALHLVMRVRDEAHRFALAYHRQRRGKAMTTSALDALKGVGPMRKKRLLRRFGSIAAIKRANLDEIAAVKGMTSSLASRVKSALGE